MERRISYGIIKSGLSLSELLESDFIAFRSWYLKEDKKLVEKYNEHLSNEDFILILEQYDSFDKILGVGQVKLDEFVLEFIYMYCDFYGLGSDFFKSIGPEMSTWRYTSSTDIVKRYLDTKSYQLWNYLFEGRSMFKDRPFSHNEDAISIGFWKANEVEHFYNQINKKIGTIENVKEIFWTAGEKQKYQKALKDSKYGIFGLADYNPSSSGIEYLLQTLEEMDGNFVDLVFCTEQ